MLLAFVKSQIGKKLLLCNGFKFLIIKLYNIFIIEK